MSSKFSMSKTKKPKTPKVCKVLPPIVPSFTPTYIANLDTFWTVEWELMVEEFTQIILTDMTPTGPGTWELTGVGDLGSSFTITLTAPGPGSDVLIDLVQTNPSYGSATASNNLGFWDPMMADFSVSTSWNDTGSFPLVGDLTLTIFPV